MEREWEGQEARLRDLEAVPMLLGKLGQEIPLLLKLI